MALFIDKRRVNSFAKSIVPVNFFIFLLVNLQKLIGLHNNQSALNHLKLSGLGLFILLMLLSTPAISQEKPGMTNEESERIQEELTSHQESAATQNKVKEVARDTTSVKLAAPKPKSEAVPPKEAEEETLSFNILYFIIQKFKVSDMIN